ncbi:MAG: ANTAR domain-containing protein [Lachnospiraceae bacterium]|nr:ANTAR domain-containing protein [Lachnospiraceae bacterium]
MTFKERYYRTLVVSSSSKFNDNITPILTSSHCEPIVFANSVAAAKRCSLESPFDFVIINTPLPDELGSKYAIDISMNKNTLCLMFIRSEIYEEVKSKVMPYGVFTLPKPTASISIKYGLDFLSSSRERLRSQEKKTLSIEEKMEEIRLVNHAKWLLIDHLKMTEQDAHRYIEKQAMDACVSKSEIAKEIIATYS